MAIAESVQLEGPFLACTLVHPELDRRWHIRIPAGPVLAYAEYPDDPDR